MTEYQPYAPNAIERSSQQNQWSMVPAVMLWIVSLCSSLFVLHGVLELLSANGAELGQLHPLAKQVMAIHFAAFLCLAVVSFLGGNAWMLRRTRLATRLSALTFLLVAGAVWNILRLVIA